MSHDQMVQTLRTNHAVALRNAGYAALTTQTLPPHQQAVLREVRDYLAKGYTLANAIDIAQRISNTEAKGLDLEYGPFVDVARVWELYGAPLLAKLRADQPTETGNTAVCTTCGGYGTIDIQGDRQQAPFTPRDTEVCPACDGSPT